MRTRTCTAARIAAIRECAAAIRTHTLNDLAGLDGTERLGIIEEMEGKR